MARPPRWATLAWLLLFLIPGLGAAPRSQRDSSDLGRLTQVLDFIRSEYAGEVDTGRLVDGALEGVMSKLDSHSRYFDAAAYEDLRSGTSGAYSGIGVGLCVRGGRATILSVAPGSPAARAGVRVADRIVAVAGTPVRGLEAAEVGRLLRGPAHTRVSLRLCSPAGSIREAVVAREPVPVPSVPAAFLLDRGIAYVRIERFSERTGEEFRNALEGLVRAKPRAMVLDLRGNPGGVLAQAVNVAEHFIPRGKLVASTEGRHLSQDRLYFSNGRAPRVAVPVAVLVDAGTASAAEVLAGALQDWDLAVLVGTRTYGKGSVQTILPLEGGGGIKLTTARYYTPSGRSFDRPEEPAEAEAPPPEGGLSAGAGAPWALRESNGEPESRSGARGEPLFITASGRAVRGGGGIDPDVEAAPETEAALIAPLEAGGFFTTFVHEAGAGADGDRVTRFLAHAAKELGSAIDDGARGDARAIAWRIRREEARKDEGPEAAERVALAHDAVFAKAVALLGRGESLSQLLHEVEGAEAVR